MNSLGLTHAISPPMPVSSGPLLSEISDRSPFLILPPEILLNIYARY